MGFKDRISTLGKEGKLWVEQDGWVWTYYALWADSHGHGPNKVKHWVDRGELPGCYIDGKLYIKTRQA